MYSRSVKVRTDERYASNIPPVYGGSRFYRAPPSEGITVQNETRKAQNPPLETVETAEEVPAVPPLCEAVAVCESDSAQDAPPEAPRTEISALPPSRKEGHGNFLQSFTEGDKEELLLIAVLLLLCGEEERAGDMIAILLLLIILR